MPSMGGREPHLALRRSGLYVLQDGVQRTILYSDFMKLKRLMGAARLHLMEARFFCRECQQPIALDQQDRLVQGANGNAAGGRFVLRCGCTVWEVKE